MNSIIKSISLFIFLAPVASAQSVSLEKISLPKGFKISVFAKVSNARSMALSPKGVLFVGNRSEDRVYAVVDKNKDFIADKVVTVASGLTSPNGVALKDGTLYIAGISKLYKIPNAESYVDTKFPKPTVVYRKFPTDWHHGWKFIRFGPDGWLYIPVGAPCNICDAGSKYASIFRIKPDGTQLEAYSRGVRNTVGFDWHPDTGQLWFTDNGRDFLGDDRPPDELNLAVKKGQHFGYPFCHGKNIKDPKFGSKKDCSKYRAPKVELPAHVAALGLRFYTGKMFPKKYHKQIFIAEHGSWNRSKAQGYRISTVSFNGAGVPKYEVFADGWLNEKDDSKWGRPVDIEIMPDGSMLVSDDHAGVIYRISYRP